MRTAELPAALRRVYAKMLSYQPAPSEDFFALTAATAQRASTRKIVVMLRDREDAPAAGVRVTQEWPDGHETLVSDAQGKVEFNLGPGSRFVPPRGGPHRVYVGDPESLQSDLIYSLGSPDGQVLTYELTFREQTA